MGYEILLEEGLVERASIALKDLRKEYEYKANSVTIIKGQFENVFGKYTYDFYRIANKIELTNKYIKKLEKELDEFTANYSSNHLINQLQTTARSSIELEIFENKQQIENLKTTLKYIYISIQGVK